VEMLVLEWVGQLHVVADHLIAANKTQC
jgi:hypothetical protein